jgi:hypothetical protein
MPLPGRAKSGPGAANGMFLGIPTPFSTPDFSNAPQDTQHLRAHKADKAKHDKGQRQHYHIPLLAHSTMEAAPAVTPTSRDRSPARLEVQAGKAWIRVLGPGSCSYERCENHSPGARKHEKAVSGLGQQRLSVRDPSPRASIPRQVLAKSEGATPLPLVTSNAI